MKYRRFRVITSGEITVYRVRQKSGAKYGFTYEFLSGQNYYGYSDPDGGMRLALSKSRTMQEILILDNTFVQFFTEVI